MTFEQTRCFDPELAGTTTRLGQVLEYASIFYLFIPFPLYLFGYLKLPYAIVAMGILITALVVCLRGRFQGIRVRAMEWRNGDGARLAAILTLTLAWSFLCGIGGFKGQSGDYIKHNAVLMELIEESWPPHIPDLQAPEKWTWLVYYPGYYLPAALAGKVFGWNGAYAFWTLWTVFGVFLCVAWLMRIQRGLSLQTFFLFVLFGGLDFIAYGLLHPDGQALQGTSYFDWWARIVCFPANSTGLDNGPQHALPAWILMGMVMHDGLRRKRLADMGLYLLAALIWSPFVACGILPFVILASVEERWHGAFSFQNCIAAPLVGLTLALYYMSRRYSLPKGPYWTATSFAQDWYILPVFWIVEFGVYALFCYDPDIFTGTSRRRRWWWLALGVLMALPAFRYGINNDLAMRGAVPSLLFLITVLDTRLRVSHISKDTQAKILLVLLAMGMLPGLNSLLRGLDEFTFHFPAEERRPPRFATEERGKYSPQYLGDPEHFYYRHLCRRQPGSDILSEKPLPVELEVIATGEKNPASNGAAIWLWRFYKENGAAIPWDDMLKDGDWVEREEQKISRMHSAGLRGSTIRWEGESDQNLILLFLSHSWSGKVKVRWQGQEKEIDLYSPRRNELYRLKLPLAGWDETKAMQ